MAMLGIFMFHYGLGSCLVLLVGLPMLGVGADMRIAGRRAFLSAASRNGAIVGLVEMLGGVTH
jgi:hypothetical protein